MLLVTIELLPSTGGERRTLGEIRIGNDGFHPARPGRGNYNAIIVPLGDEDETLTRVRRDREEALTLVRVEDFPREERTAFDLLYRVLKEAVGERNNG